MNIVAFIVSVATMRAVYTSLLLLWQLNPSFSNVALQLLEETSLHLLRNVSVTCERISDRVLSYTS